MTISTSGFRVEYSGNGVTTSFAFPYQFIAQTDLVVTLVSSAGAESTKVKDTDYTVTGGDTGSGAATGSITTTSFTPAAGETLVIERETSRLQGVDYVDNDPLPAETIESLADRLTLIAQEVRGRIDRAVRQKVGETLILDRVPIVTDRASKVFAWTAAGQPTVSTVTLADIEAVVNAATEVEIGTMPVGTEGAPGLPFTGDADTGIFQPSANEFAVSLAGSRTLLLQGTAMTYTAATGNDAAFTLDSDVDTGQNAVIDMLGHDNAANDTTYSRIASFILNNTDGAEDGQLSLYTIQDGSVAEKMRLEANGHTFFFTNGASRGLSIQNNNAGANGCVVTTYHNSASPADGDLISVINMVGNHDGSVTSPGSFTAAQIDVTADDVTENSEDASIRFTTMNAGVFTGQGQIGDGWRLNASDAFQGAGRMNSRGFFVRDRLLAGLERYQTTSISGTPTQVQFSNFSDLDGVVGSHMAVLILLEDITPTTDDDDLRIRIAVQGGALDTGANYEYSGSVRINGTSVGVGAAGQTSWNLCRGAGGADDVSNVAGEGINGWIWFHNIAQTTKQYYTAMMNYRRANASTNVHVSISGRNDTSGKLDDIHFLWGSGGTFQNVGRMEMYMIRTQL